MFARRPKINRIYVLLGVSIIFALIIAVQLFRLQVINKNYYMAKAEEGHLGYSEIGARRGEILIKDYHSGEEIHLATNTSFPALFADPTLIKDPVYLSDKLAPILFDKQLADEKEAQRIREQKRLLPDNPTKEELARIAPKPEEDLKKDFRNELFEKLSQKTRSSIVLYKLPTAEMLKFLETKNLPGIEATPLAITAYPAQISDRDYAAGALSPIVDIPRDRLSELFVGRNRYVVLRQKTPPGIEKQVRDLIEADKKEKKNLFTGINFQKKDYRYYPEGQLAAQALGFVGSNGSGLYGIEKSFDEKLRGKKGIFKTKLDATGQQVIVGDDLIIQPAINGSDITLTIDRSVQMETEKYLEKAVKDSRADSGLAIIMDPKTGRIVTMAHYPTFDPNNFSRALETEDIALTDAEKENIVAAGDPGEEINWLYLDADSHYRIQVFKTVMETGKIIISKFKNILGSGVYRNRAVSDLYEPGSVFKSIAMAIALDDGDVTPQTTFNDTGPIKVDEFEIHNATNSYGGITNMRTVIEKSLNTGMAFVARKMGRELFYRYLKKFGFGERTYIEFEDERSGKIKEASKWAESELITYAFGQGIAVTPMQFITAVAALANNGILMKPHIVLGITGEDGKMAEVEPERVRRVISEKAAATITAMMVSVIENGGAKRAVIPGYHIAGKTGTAQTYKRGKPLTGPGTTIASFIGFGPVKNPRFIILTQIDRPRSSIWADSTAAPLFADIAKFLIKYYNIPPDA